MAKFKQNNVELKDNQKLILDSAKTKYMSYDGSEVFINTTISGADPTIDGHLTTKQYVDVAITTATGSLTADHASLTNLDYASAGHTGFQAAGDYTTSAELATTSGGLQSQIDTNASDLSTHSGDSTIHFLWATVSSTIDHNTINNTHNLTTDIDHGNIGGLDGDDHTQYVPTTATRGFTAAVSGVDPTQDYHLVTKSYMNDNPPTVLFGSEYDYATSSGQSSTTSDTYQQKLRLTTSTVPTGTYRIGWAFEYSSTTDKVDCGFRVQIDDTTTINEFFPAPKKKYNDGNWDNISGFGHNSLTNASHTIDIDYIANVDAEAGTTYIRKARIEIWRVE